jgi:hypothetical protein
VSVELAGATRSGPVGGRIQKPKTWYSSAAQLSVACLAFAVAGAGLQTARNGVADSVSIALARVADTRYCREDSRIHRFRSLIISLDSDDGGSPKRAYFSVTAPPLALAP